MGTGLRAIYKKVVREIYFSELQPQITNRSQRADLSLGPLGGGGGLAGHQGNPFAFCTKHKSGQLLPWPVPFLRALNQRNYPGPIFLYFPLGKKLTMQLSPRMCGEVHLVSGWSLALGLGFRPVECNADWTGCGETCLNGEVSTCHSCPLSPLHHGPWPTKTSSQWR